MGQKKIILLLKSIHKSEIRQLKTFFRTPYFNSNPTITELFDYLIKFHPDYPESKIDNQIIHQRFFKKETYKARKINDLLSDIGLLVEEFMRLQLIKQNEQLKSQVQRAMLKQRQLNELYTKHLRKNAALVQSKAAKNEYDYESLIDLKRALIETPKFNYLSSEYADILNSTTTELDEYFILTNLKNQIAQKALLEVSKTDVVFDKSFISNDDIANSIYSNNPLIDLYRLMLQTYEQVNSVAAFQQLKEAFYKYLDIIDAPNSKLVYAVLQNIANNPKASTAKLEIDAVELYKVADQKDWLAINGTISPTRYINICITAYKVKAYEWADFFVAKYKPLLPQQDMDDTILLGELYKLESQREWLAVIDLLVGKRMRLLENNLRSRTILIRSYYSYAVDFDSDFLEKTVLACEAFERFIKRKEILSQNKVDSYLNFTSIIKKMVRLQEAISINNQDITELKKAISTYKEIVALSWIVEKTNELSNQVR